MLPGDSAELRKARGAFFTPAPVARFIADWAVRSSKDAVLEPSCGEAVFLHEAGRDGLHAGPLVGVELHASSARESERTLRAMGIKADIHPARFFSVMLAIVLANSTVAHHKDARDLMANPRP